MSLWSRLRNVLGIGEPAIGVDPVMEPGRAALVVVNDDKPPLAFVVEELCRTLDLSREGATKLMFRIQRRGSAIVAILASVVARRSAAPIAANAHAAGHPLNCTVKEE